MNKKKIHKIIVKLITGLCIVVYFTTNGIIGFKNIDNSIHTNAKYNVEYHVSNNKTMLTGKINGKDAPHDWYVSRLNKLATDYNKKLNVVSGYRSYEQQLAMYNSSDKSGKFVAKAGCSRHNAGLAVDVSGWATQLTNKDLEKYGLYKPMSYENWHIEPVETKGKTTQQIIAKYGLPSKTVNVEQDAQLVINNFIKGVALYNE